MWSTVIIVIVDDDDDVKAIKSISKRRGKDD